MDRSTEIGGGERNFPPTRWSVIRDASDRGSETFRSSLAEMASLYWRPVYSYFRRKWAKTNDEAKDLAQEFFASLSEKELFRNATPDVGRFRSYVMTTLDNVARMDRRARDAQKRGGGVAHVSLPIGEGFEPAAAENPEAAFDREWMGAILDDALGELAEEYRTRNQGPLFRLFVEKEVEPVEPEPTYEQLAAKHALSVTEVRNALYRGKKRLRELVLKRVRETVASDADAEVEFRHLFGGGA